MRYGTLSEEIRWFQGKHPPKMDRLQGVWHQYPTEFAPDRIRMNRHFAVNPLFNTVIILMIIFNTVMVGIEVDYGRASRIEDKLGFFTLELIFGVTFAFETSCRLHREGWIYFESGWNIFDYCLVVLSACEILMALTDVPSTIGAKSLRVLRFTRVVRSIRGLKIVAGLWLIIQGMIDSVRAVFWVACACLLLVYLFAVALTTICGQDLQVQVQWVESPLYVGSVLRSMLTVLQIITLDSWTEDIARPLADASPLALVVVFMAIVVLAFGTLNILVAVMVERIGQMSQSSKESNQKVIERSENALLSSMLDEFSDVEGDGSGELSFKEFRKLIRTQSMSRKLSYMGVNCEEAESLFEIMDVDRSGTITPSEFLDGILKVKGHAKGQDVVNLIAFSQKQCLKATRFVELVRSMSFKVDSMQERLDACGISASQELLQQRAAQDAAGKILKEAHQVKDVLKKLDLDKAKAYPKLIDDGQSEWGELLE